MTMLIPRAPAIATATAILLAVAWAWRRHVRPRAARPQTVSAGRIVVAASLLDAGVGGLFAVGGAAAGAAAAALAGAPGTAEEAEA